MNPTSKARKACTNWLVYCLKIGWPPGEIPKLEQLWWRYHDESGKLLMGPEYAVPANGE